MLWQIWARTHKDITTDGHFQLLVASGLLHLVEPFLAGVQAHWSGRMADNQNDPRGWLCSHENVGSTRPKLDGDLMELEVYHKKAASDPAAALNLATLALAAPAEGERALAAPALTPYSICRIQGLRCRG